MVKQGCILKQFEDFEQLFEIVVFIEPALYFKINLYKLVSKYPVLGRPTLSSHCFKNNFRLINLFVRKTKICFKCEGK